MFRYSIWMSLLVAACGGQPAVDAPTPQAASTTAQVASTTPHHSAVGVMGHWTLEVRTPDGTVVERRELHNDYVDSNNLIVSTLLGDKVPGGWQIALNSETAGNNNICHNDGSRFACYIREDLSGAGTNTYYHHTLVVSGASHLVRLEGSVEAYHDGDITTVRTNLYVCDPPTALVDCTYPSPGLGAITETTLSPPLEMKKNQSLYVTVEISFVSTPP